MNHNEDTILEQNEPFDPRTPPTSENYESNIFSDIFAFPWIPLKSSVDTWEAYHAMGAQGSVTKLLTLAIVNGVAAVFGLILIIGGNPYIDFAYDLNYLPFILAFILLIPASFLIHTVAHFLCFRAISGKGNLVAHGYLEVVSSTNILLLFWTAIFVIYVTRMRGLDNVIIILGGLYILGSLVISVRATRCSGIHK